MLRLRHWIEVAAFHALSLALRGVPRSWALAAGSFLGSFWYRTDPRHRRIAIDNLRLAFGSELDAAAARKIAHENFHHLGRIAIDTLTLFKRSPETLERLVTYRGLENLERAYAEPSGVLIFSGHFGHWELMAYLQAHRGMPMDIVARRLDNPRLEKLLAGLRTRSGNTLLYKENAVRELLRMVKGGGAAAILIDQDQRHHGIFVPFFGRPASTTPTLAMLALRTDAAVIPTFTLPTPDGGYEIVYEPPIQFERTGNMEDDVLRLTAVCTERLEEWVRRYPQYWLWMHRRWKTQPEE